jgi:RNA polymerase sigma-70 factor (ECF subfamily)
VAAGGGKELSPLGEQRYTLLAMPADPSETTRSSLIRRVQNPDDKTAWSEFWTFYEPLLARYIRRLKVKPDDAGDLLQDMYPKLLEELPKFKLDRGRGQFRGWLRRVSDNAVRDFFRARDRRQRRNEELAEYLAAVQKALEETPEGEAERERAWVKSVSVLVMQRVREEFRRRETTLACFEKTILEQRPAKEVAAELGIDNVNNVYAYTSKVMARVKALKREYDQYELGEEEEEC